MMRKWFIQIGIMVVVLCLMGNISVNAQKKTSASVSGALFLKLVPMEKNLASVGDIIVYVLGNEEVAAELKKGIGKSIGGSTLKNVLSGTDLPAEKPSCMFVGNPDKVNDAIAYTRAKKILSVTNDPGLVTKGVTLGLGIGGDGKPKILLNISSSSEEGLDWNPAIMKIAQVVK